MTVNGAVWAADAQALCALNEAMDHLRTADIPVLIMSKLEFDANTLSTFRAAGVLYVHKSKLFLNELVTAVELSLQFGRDRERLQGGPDPTKFLEGLSTLQVH